MEPVIDNLAQNLFAQELLDQRNYRESVAAVFGALERKYTSSLKAHDDSAADLELHVLVLATQCTKQKRLKNLHLSYL